MALDRNNVQLRSMILASRTVCILALPLLIVGAPDFYFEDVLLSEQQTITENISSPSHDFTDLLYQKLADENDNENVAISPVNLYILLSLLAHGASGPTLDELRSVLAHKDIVSLNEEFNALILLLNKIESIELRTASRLFLRHPYTLTFSTICIDVFNASITSVEFEDRHLTQQIINSWIQETTNKKISHVISLHDLYEATIMVLINAISFKGKWLEQFDKNKTKNRIFRNWIADNRIVPTMFMKAAFNHGRVSQWKASFVEIPYADPDFVLVILLPDIKVKLETVESHFNWKTLANAPRYIEDTELYLPKFNVEIRTDLKKVLKQIGLNVTFSIDADFAHVSKYPIFVDRWVQTIFLEFNEEGSEAAAATIVQGKTFRSRIAAKLPTLFVVGRPFLFAIEYKPRKIPLFLGSVRKITDKINDKPMKTEL